MINNIYGYEAAEQLSLSDVAGVAPGTQIMSVEEIKAMTWLPTSGAFKSVGGPDHLDFIEQPLGSYAVEGMLTARTICYISGGEFVEGFTSIVTAERGEIKSGQSKSPRGVWGKSGNSDLPYIAGSAINLATFTFHKEGILMEEAYQIEPWLKGTDPRVEDTGKKIFGMENPIKTATIAALAEGVHYREIEDCFYNLIIYLSSENATQVSEQVVTKWRSEYAARIIEAVPHSGAIELLTIAPLINNSSWVKEGRGAKGLPILNVRTPLWRTYARPIFQTHTANRIPPNMGGKFKMPGAGAVKREELKRQADMELNAPKPKPVVTPKTEPTPSASADVAAKAEKLLAEVIAETQPISKPQAQVATEPVLTLAQRVLQQKQQKEQDEPVKVSADFFADIYDEDDNGSAADGSDICL